MMELISLFKERNWTVTFASAASKNENSVPLGEQDIQQSGISVNSSDFNDFIGGLQPSVVIFDRFITEEQFGWRVESECPEALRILDTEDLHCLRRARRRAVQEHRSFEVDELLEDKTAQREIASIYRCDLSLIISDFEIDLLQNLFGIDPSLLHYLPFLLDVKVTPDHHKGPSFDERTNFVTIGNFRHPPNWDAIRYLKREIWPLIRKKLPGAELHNYGAYPADKAYQLHDPAEGFLIEGRVEDADAVVAQSRIVLAPLRFGAGLKGKLVQAMQCRTPSVTTSIGAEGLQGDYTWPGAIAETPETIASEAVELYSNRESWQKARQQGIKILDERFGRASFGIAFMDRLEELQKNRDRHRKQNFIGGMLRHHTTASTKYMSRWIEEKNKQQ